jgi:hypothetical protein
MSSVLSGLARSTPRFGSRCLVDRSAELVGEHAAAFLPETGDLPLSILFVLMFLDQRATPPLGRPAKRVDPTVSPVVMIGCLLVILLLTMSIARRGSDWTSPDAFDGSAATVRPP